MKANLFFILSSIIWLSAISCERLNDNDDPQGLLNDSTSNDSCTLDTCYSCDLNKSSEIIYNNLLDAYRDSCLECLEQILNNWEKEYNYDTNIPDSLKDVYDVFKEFYSPWDLGRISESEFGNNIYAGYSHYIIQDKIKYNSSFRSLDADNFTVFNFRPQLSNDTIKIHYLHQDYEDAINCFLGSDYQSMGFGNLMTPAFPIEESYLRYKFLNNYLQFFHGHWGNYWHLETHPEVETISFNIERDSAQVYFRLGYQGGEVILGRDGASWIIVDHYMTWIE